MKGNSSGMEFNLESEAILNLEIREDTQSQTQSKGLVWRGGKVGFGL